MGVYIKDSSIVKYTFPDRTYYDWIRYSECKGEWSTMSELAFDNHVKRLSTGKFKYNLKKALINNENLWYH